MAEVMEQPDFGGSPSAGSQALCIQVPILGAKGAGKSAALRAVLNDACLSSVGSREEADGLFWQRVACEHRGLEVVVDLLELPADDRYAPLLPHFVAAAACLLLVVAAGDPEGPRDLEERMAALGRAPPCGVVLVMGGGAQEPQSQLQQRLDRLRDLAGQWRLQLSHCESLEELERARLLQLICRFVARDIPGEVDALHLLGKGISRGP